MGEVPIEMMRAIRERAEEQREEIEHERTRIEEQRQRARALRSRIQELKKEVERRAPTFSPASAPEHPHARPITSARRAPLKK